MLVNVERLGRVSEVVAQTTKLPWHHVKRHLPFWKGVLPDLADDIDLENRQQDFLDRIKLELTRALHVWEDDKVAACRPGHRLALGH